MKKIFIKRIITIIIITYLVISTLVTVNETGKGKEFWEAVDIGFFFGKLNRYEHNLIKTARDMGYTEDQIKQQERLMKLLKDPNFHMNPESYLSGYGNEIKYSCKSGKSKNLKILVIKEFPSSGNITNMIILPITNKKEAELKGKKRNVNKLKQYCFKNLADFQQPLAYKFIEKFPKNISYN